MPALLIRPSMRPRRSSTVGTRRAIDSSSPMSASTMLIRPSPALAATSAPGCRGCGRRRPPARPRGRGRSPSRHRGPGSPGDEDDVVTQAQIHQTPSLASLRARESSRPRWSPRRSAAVARCGRAARSWSRGPGRSAPSSAGSGSTTRAAVSVARTLAIEFEVQGVQRVGLGHRRGAVGHRPGRLDLGPRQRERLRDRAQLDQRRAELLAREGVRARLPRAPPGPARRRTPPR